MSLVPDLGHLYHDSSISNSSVILDAKEYLRTREINAREQRHLDQLNKYLIRAKIANERLRNQETCRIHQSLRCLQIRTPTIERGLQRETERLRRLQQRQSATDKSRQGSPSFVLRNEGQTAGPLFNCKPNNTRGSRHLYSPQHAPTAGTSSNSDKVPNSNNPVGESLLPEAVSTRSRKRRKYYATKAEPLGGRARSAECITINLLKRADNVMRSLHKVYQGITERDQTEKGKMLTLKELLVSDSRDSLERARMVLGHKTTSKIVGMFANRENMVTSTGQSDTTSITTQSLHEGSISRAKLSPDYGHQSDVDLTELSSHEFTDSDDRNVMAHATVASQARRAELLCKHPSGKDTLLRNLSALENHGDRKFERKPGFNTDVCIYSLSQGEPILAQDQINSRATYKPWFSLETTRSLWQQSTKNVHKEKSPKQTTVVTLTGKHRRTLLRR